MKRFIIFLVVLLFGLSTVSAQLIKEMNSNIDIYEKNKARIEIQFRITDKINQIDIPIEGMITDLTSENANCFILSDIQQVIECKPLTTFKGESNLTVSFSTNDLIKTDKNVTSFTFDLPIMWKTDRVSIIARLPLGMALSDKIMIPVSPSNSEIGSDGRRIFVKWQFAYLESDDIIPIRIYYENINSPDLQKTNPMIIIFLAVLLSAVFILYMRIIRKRSNSGLVLSVLNEGERIIVEIIQNQQEDDVDQRKIVALSGFSKAKVSRIIQSLEQRGVVESNRTGRKNKIVLKKKFVKDETEQS